MGKLRCWKLSCIAEVQINLHRHVAAANLLKLQIVWKIMFESPTWFIMLHPLALEQPKKIWVDFSDSLSHCQFQDGRSPPATMHYWKVILKSNETVSCSVSLVEDMESRAHLQANFLFFFSSYAYEYAYAFVIQKKSFLSPCPSHLSLKYNT